MPHEVLKRQILAMIDEINATERSLALPVIEGFDDFDRMEAMDIINRIERSMATQLPADAHQEAE